MNVCTFIGNLGQSNELRYTQSGKAVLTNSLAVKKNIGEGTTWIPLVIWNKPAEATSNFTQKGSKVGVTGELQEESWEKDGKKHTKLVLNVAKIEFLDGKKSDNKVSSDNVEGFAELEDEEFTPF